MTRRRWITRIVLMLTVAVCLTGRADADPADEAKAIISRAKTPGKLCVVVGSAGGELLVELNRAGGFLVQGLSPDAELVAKARTYIQAKGLYGMVTVQQHTLAKFPYTEDLVSLLVVTDPKGMAVSEIVRVLAPGGVVIIRKDGAAVEDLKKAARAMGVQGDLSDIAAGGWLRLVKPVPAGMDVWTHDRHDATGNPVSADTLAGPPRRVRWVMGPVGGANNFVSADGRSFYGSLHARDSYNGLLLWRRSLNMNRIMPVTDGKRVFAAHAGKLLALDAATGETLLTYKQAGWPLTRILHADGVLIAIGYDALRVQDVETGKRLWKRQASVPGCVTVGEGRVFFIEGNTRRGELSKLTALDLKTGQLLWQKTVRLRKKGPTDYEWLPKAARSSYYKGRLAFEVSTFTDLPEPNGIYVVSAKDGEMLWTRSYPPHGAHAKQARALFARDLAWVVQNNKLFGLDLASGSVRHEFKGGSGHCYPPVATTRFIFSGEMSVTDLVSGQLDENRITKGSCSRNAGVIPANGLAYAFPKSCVCWPMLKGYAALAPAKPASGGRPATGRKDLVIERGSAQAPPSLRKADPAAEWPSYRYDAGRSGATPAEVPTELTVLWRQRAARRKYRQPYDWRYNPFVSGAITPPVVAAGLVIVAAPDQHQVVAVDAASGAEKWRFTADGRVDTPPTVVKGRVLFGTHGGSVYCLSAADGKLLWRGRAAADDEQILAFGQVESPWPVPGSVLVMGDTAYFAAGRQYLADGGVRVFAVDVKTGRSRWVSRINTLGKYSYYGAAGLEFDNFDLLVAEGDKVSMSRWLLDRKTGGITVVPKSGFFRTGPAGVLAPRGCWSYGPRMGRGHDRKAKRPLVVFRDNTLISCTPDRMGLFRRDFSEADRETFDAEWFNFRLRKEYDARGEGFTRTDRLARGARWDIDELGEAPISAMLLAGDKAFVADEQGELRVVSIADGKVLGRMKLPAAPIWDGLAAANGRIYAALANGAIVCLGQK